MKKRRLEEVITAYWVVGTALRHPTAPSISAKEALTLIDQQDRLIPGAEEARLLNEMHILKYDIIEASTEWRSPTPRVNGIILRFVQR